MQYISAYNNQSVASCKLRTTCTIIVYLLGLLLSVFSSSLEYMPDVQLAFGLPFYAQYKNQYTLEEKTLSLAVMQYLSNFIKSG